MKQVMSADGSVTFFNEEFNEHYHSTTGALQESLEKFVKPARLKEKAKAGKVVILDVCFGLGYNSASAIDYILGINPDCIIEIFGLENDIKIIKKINELDVDLSSYNHIKELASKKINDKKINYNNKNINITVILGDARGKIKEVETQVDVVFLDPFSPKVCPQLWGESFIKNIADKMRSGAVLTTYSCARLVRDNLKKAGLIISDGPKVGRRGPSTIATKF